MSIHSVSAAFTTNKVAQSRDFYVKHFGAKVTFDCGWYVNLEFGSKSSMLQFMSPQQPAHRLSNSDGLVYNFEVEDVDKEHDKLSSEGVLVVLAIEDHPWGDRGFVIQDPNGISLYIYSLREPSDEFKQFFKE